MKEYRQGLQSMTDDELSTEWVRVMVAEVQPDNREAQLASIDAVADEVNTRYRQADFRSLVITPEDALSVTNHLKRLIGANGSDWFGPDRGEGG